MAQQATALSGKDIARLAQEKHQQRQLLADCPNDGQGTVAEFSLTRQADMFEALYGAMLAGASDDR